MMLLFYVQNCVDMQWEYEKAKKEGVADNLSDKICWMWFLQSHPAKLA